MTDQTQTTTEPVLLPCPFCGGEAWLNDYEAKHSDLPPQSRAPQCRSCGVSPGYLPTAKKAVSAWNRRPALSPPAEGEVSAEKDWVCKCCNQHFLSTWTDRVASGFDEYGTGPSCPVCKAGGAYTYRVGFHQGDPCIHCGSPHDDVAVGPCPMIRPATPTPAPVDWNVVGPKLVEALERIKANDPNDPAQPWNVARAALAALAAAQPGAK